MLLLSDDLLNPKGVSATAITAAATLVEKFPALLLEQIIIHPRLSSNITWDNIPASVKQQAEMSFYSGYELDDTYRIYGVDPSRGALLAVRPDGYVGIIAELSDVPSVDAYLSRVITRDT